MILIDWSIYEKGNQEDCKKNGDEGFEEKRQESGQEA